MNDETMNNEQGEAQRFWGWLAGQRTTVQVVSALTLNSFFTQHVTRGIPCPALNCHACHIGSIQHFIGRRKFPLYVLGVIGLVGALIGRASYGWFCPFGWFQQLVYKIPVPKLRLPNRYNWTRYVVLALLVVVIPLITRAPWFCKLCPAGTLEAGIPMILLSTDVRAMTGTLYWIKIGILGLVLAWMSVTRRPFCRWICPVDVRVYENPTSGACIRCLDCVRVCPVACISVTSPGWSGG